MTKPVTIANTFATQVGNVPASELDANYSALAGAVNDLGTYSNLGTDTGIANAYIIGFPVGITATLAAGLPAAFVPLNNNTGASTANVAGTGVIALVRPDGTPLVSGDLLNTNVYQILYNAASGKWVVQNPSLFFTTILGNPFSLTTPGGLIQKGGSTVVTTNGGGQATISFGTAFPNNVYCFIPTIGDINAVVLTCQAIQASQTLSSAAVTVFVNGTSTYNSAFARINWTATGN